MFEGNAQYIPPAGDWWQQLMGGGFTQANPYSQGILNTLGGQQAGASGAMTNAYGNMDTTIQNALQGFDLSGVNNTVRQANSLVGSTLGNFNTQGMNNAYGSMSDYLRNALGSFNLGGMNQNVQGAQGLIGNALGNFNLGGMNNAYGNMNDLVSSSLNNFNPSNFLSQFLQQSGGLGALAQGSQVGQDALMSQAKEVGNNAVQDVASQFAGLGSLYSGGAAQEATKAFAAPMFQAMQQGSAQQSQLLNNLYGNAMSGLQQGNQASLQAGMQGAGLAGQAMNPQLQAILGQAGLGMQGAGLFGNLANTMLGGQQAAGQLGVQGAGLFGQAMNPQLQAALGQGQLGMQGANTLGNLANILLGGQTAQGNLGMQGAGLYGQQGGAMAGLTASLGNNLAAMGAPQLMSNSTLLQQIMSGVGNLGTGAAGLAMLLPFLGIPV